jgi:hypothetical protein
MIDVVNEVLMIGDALVVATRGATDVAVHGTGLIGTGTGNVKRTESEGIGTATTTDTVTAIGKETMRETVADAGAKMKVTRQKNVPGRDVARRVRTKPLLNPLLLGTVHAGVLRGPIPEIVMVIDVQSLPAIPETNSMTRPSTGGIVGDAEMSAALVLRTTANDARHPRPQYCMSSYAV